MEHRLWRDIRFRLPNHIPTMITVEEQQYLYWLGSQAWTGAGNVVEIGPWLGGSTVCLAAGMRASGHPSGGRLHAYDNYLWRRFMSARAPINLSEGESFESHFLANVSNFGDIVVSHARELPNELSADVSVAVASEGAVSPSVAPLTELREGPVEVLFVDGAKSWGSMRQLLIVAQKHLVENNSVVVCQDFKYWHAYWIPVMMMHLWDSMQPIHNVRGSTTVAFRVTRVPSYESLTNLPVNVAELDPAVVMRHIKEAATMLSRDGDAYGAHGVALSAISFLVHRGNIDDAARRFNNVQARWPIGIHDAQLELARRFLMERNGSVLPAPARLRLSRLVVRARRRVARSMARKVG